MNLFAENIIEKTGKETSYAPDKTEIQMSTATSHWTNCRESLQSYFRGSMNIDKSGFFIIPTLDIEQIIKFVNALEDGLKLEQRTVFHKACYFINQNDSEPKYDSPSATKVTCKKAKKTICNDAFYIKLSPFWLEHPLKFSFFTATIKLIDYEEEVDFSQCGTMESIANYLIDLDDDFEYFGHTKEAVKRFLNGHVNIKRSRKKIAGWVDVFDKRSWKDDYESRIERILT